MSDDYVVKNHDNYEPRNCFKTTKHTDHIHDVNTFGIPGKPDVSRFWCNGNAPRPEPALWAAAGPEVEFNNAVNGLGEELPHPDYTAEYPDAPLNAELAVRPEYGDPLQNMREQAAMFNAYLSGRPVTEYDVPVFFILAKLHRMGKMPDYGDNYKDVKGYLKLLEGLVGQDMIEAETAAEYRRLKAELAPHTNMPAEEWDVRKRQQDGTLPHVEDFIPQDVANHLHARYGGSKHPYQNIENGEGLDDFMGSTGHENEV
jgi:hypothetical protein